MAHSYAYLLKKAGQPLPEKPRRPYPKNRVNWRKREAVQKEALRHYLDQMVADGALTKDSMGRYGLPEWQQPDNGPTGGH